MKEEYKDPAKFWDDMLINDPIMQGCTQDRLHANAKRWVRCPSPDADEIETLYLDGTTAHGKPAGHRFPTDSGKLEFGRPSWIRSLLISGYRRYQNFTPIRNI